MSNSFNDEVTIRSGDFKGFIHSVIAEDVDGVAYYISMGIDVNFLHPEIMTNPLIEAVRVENIEIVKLLLENGANPQTISQLGESPIQVAKSSGNKELLAILKGRRSPFSFHQLFKKFR